MQLSSCRTRGALTLPQHGTAGPLPPRPSLWASTQCALSADRASSASSATLSLPIHSRQSPQRCLRSAMKIYAAVGDVAASRSTGASTLVLERPQKVAQEFIWARHWWAVSPLDSLHKDKPNPATILGKELVIWHHEERGWVVMEDKCPHRLAPLSQGRISGGNLACSYHGWSWGPDGKCAGIPQMADSTLACQNSRSCAKTYPSDVVDGVLFAFLDNSPEGLLESAMNPPFMPADVRGVGMAWSMNLSHSDFTYMLEQGLDPTHADFLHSGIQSFKPEDAVPIKSLSVEKVDLKHGFKWRHAGYNKRNEGMTASREFYPPGFTRIHYQFAGNKGTATFAVMITPVSPGLSRTFFKFAIGSGSPTSSTAAAADAAAQWTLEPSGGTAADSEGASVNHNARMKGDDGGSAGAQVKKQGSGFDIFALMSRFPHWMFLRQRLVDQDEVIMHQQEHLMRRKGLTHKNYALFANEADAGVVAVNKWLGMAKYQSMWADQVYGSPDKVPQPVELTEEALLDRFERHVRYCATCQKGFNQVTKACYGLAALSVLLTAAAIGITAATVAAATATTTAAAAAAAAAAASGGAATGIAVSGAAVTAPLGWGWASGTAASAVLSSYLTLRLWEFRTERFISGVDAWRRKGGLSLVRMP